MPLPSVRLYGAKQCHARSKRSGQQCKNPAAYGMPVCRYHGARASETILRGEDHPQYRHGHETLQMRQAHREAMGRLRTLVDLAVDHGILRRRVPGRKPVRHAGTELPAGDAERKKVLRPP